MVRVAPPHWPERVAPGASALPPPSTPPSRPPSLHPSPGLAGPSPLDRRRSQVEPQEARSHPRPPSSARKTVDRPALKLQPSGVAGQTVPVPSTLCSYVQRRYYYPAFTQTGTRSPRVFPSSPILPPRALSSSALCGAARISHLSPLLWRVLLSLCVVFCCSRCCRNTTASATARPDSRRLGCPKAGRRRRGSICCVIPPQPPSRAIFMIDSSESQTPPPLHYYHSPSNSDHDRFSSRESTPISTPLGFGVPSSRTPKREKRRDLSWHRKPADAGNRTSYFDPELFESDLDEDHRFPLFPSSPPGSSKMTGAAAPIDIATRQASVSPPGQQASNLTSALQKAGSGERAGNVSSPNGTSGSMFKSPTARKDSFGASMTQWGNGTKPISVSGSNREKPHRESLAGSLVGGMSWGGISVGSWIRDEYVFPFNARVYPSA